MTMPDFATVKKIIEDVSEFIKDFVKKMKIFIGGFKKEITFEAPTATNPPIGDGE
jgi:hypothetical protein